MLSGSPLGIVVSSGMLVPIQTLGTSVDIGTTSIPYTVYITKGTTVSGTASAIVGYFSSCGTSNGQIVGTPTVATFKSNLCTGGTSPQTWSGTGGANGVLSWTCGTISCSAPYNKFTTTTTPTVAGATCNTYDLLVGSLTGTYQLWAACNVGASIAYTGGLSIVNCNAGATDCDASIRNTLGTYFQWGRNDDVTSGVSQVSYNGALTNNSTNNQYYYSAYTNGDWYQPDDNISNPIRWYAANGGNNQ